MLDISRIPQGPYCYTIKSIEYKDNGPIIHTNLCPYWGEEEGGHCHFLNKTDSILLGDQLKMCGENYGEDYE